MEIKLPDEGNGFKDAANPVPKSGSGTDLNSRLSGMTGMSYERFQTPSKDGYSISEFLTKMAQGEEVDVDSFISGGDRKRRKLSGGGYDPASGGMYDTPQPRAKDPWSEQVQVQVLVSAGVQDRVHAHTALPGPGVQQQEG